MDDKLNSADSIVKNHVMWSMGAGLIPVPIADVFAVSAIQLDMVRQLCNLYEVSYKETEGKAIISAITGSLMARAGARGIKLIPGVGSVIGGVTLAVLSGASTYALGEVFKKHFDTGGTFLDFDPSRLKKMYNEMFEKGKKYAKEIRKDQAKADAVDEELTEDVHSAPSALDRLKDLADLRKQGMLTQEEFEILKKKLLADE